MNRIEAIQNLISCVYNYNNKNILTKKEIIKIEKYYKDNYQSFTDIELFCSCNSIKNLINKLKSGRHEIAKQLCQQKALQRGILAECVFVQTLANILKLNSFCDLETVSVSDIPVEVKNNLYKVQNKSKTGCAARYAYYRKNDTENILFQYGNPASFGDATVILFRNDIIIEIKDMPALLMDKDLEYDENGHIIITDEIKKDFSNYILYIEEFNKRTSIFSEFGHNYPILSNADVNTMQEFFKSYIDLTFMDVLMTSISDRIVIIKKEDLIKPLPDGSLLISTEGSEIRTTGKNKKKVFTPLYLKSVLNKLNITVENDICYVDKNNSKVVGFVSGRGTSKITRFKLSNCFFVENNKSLIDCGNAWKFNISDIYQCKSGISIHAKIRKGKSEIKELLNY